MTMTVHSSDPDRGSMIQSRHIVTVSVNCESTDNSEQQKVGLSCVSDSWVEFDFDINIRRLHPRWSDIGRKRQQESVQCGISSHQYLWM